MNRPLASVAGLYLAGVLLGEFLSPPWPYLCAGSLALAAAAFLRAAARVRLICLLLPLAGWTNMVTRTAVLSPFDLRALVGANLEHLTLRGALSETPSQRVYEHRDGESWHTLARLEVTALRRGTNWQSACGRVAVTTPGVLDALLHPGALRPGPRFRRCQSLRSGV